MSRRASNLQDLSRISICGRIWSSATKAVERTAVLHRRAQVIMTTMQREATPSNRCCKRSSGGNFGWQRRSRAARVVLVRREGCLCYGKAGIDTPFCDRFVGLRVGAADPAVLLLLPSRTIDWVRPASHTSSTDWTSKNESILLKSSGCKQNLRPPAMRLRMKRTDWTSKNKSMWPKSSGCKQNLRPPAMRLRMKS